METPYQLFLDKIRKHDENVTTYPVNINTTQITIHWLVDSKSNYLVAEYPNGNFTVYAPIPENILKLIK